MTNKKKELTAKYWNEYYTDENTPWDIGEVSKPLLTYFKKIEDKSLDILIPGAGKAHEAVWLVEAGFKNVFVCDWAESAFEHLKKEMPEFPVQNMLVGDFFELDKSFDLIIEQTFFCAIDPVQRADYARKAASLLKPSGKLAGVLFGIEFDIPGTPFGGRKEEYIGIFAPHFEILRFEETKDSIKPRLGSELFVELEVRQ